MEGRPVRSILTIVLRGPTSQKALSSRRGVTKHHKNHISIKPGKFPFIQNLQGYHTTIFCCRKLDWIFDDTATNRRKPCSTSTTVWNLEDHALLCALIGQSKFTPRANNWLSTRGKGPLVRHVTRFKVTKNICTILSLQNLSTFVQNTTSLISRSNYSTKGSFLEIISWFCHRNTRENATISQHQSWSCAWMRLEMKLWMTYRLMSLMVDRIYM